jgi:hypothetical protein
LAPRCISYFYLNLIFDIFEILKKSKQIFFTYVFTYYVCTKSLHEKTTYRLAYVKKIKFGAKIRYFTIHVLSFYIDHMKCPIFRETLVTHMDYRDIYVKFCVGIF